MVVAQPRCVENALIVHPRGDVPQDEVGDRTALGVARTNGAPVVLAAVEAGGSGPPPPPGGAREAARACGFRRERRIRRRGGDRGGERGRLTFVLLARTISEPPHPRPRGPRVG